MANCQKCSWLIFESLGTDIRPGYSLNHLSSEKALLVWSVYACQAPLNLNWCAPLREYFDYTAYRWLWWMQSVLHLYWMLKVGINRLQVLTCNISSKHEISIIYKCNECHSLKFTYLQRTIVICICNECKRLKFTYTQLTDILKLRNVKSPSYHREYMKMIMMMEILTKVKYVKPKILSLQIPMLRTLRHHNQHLMKNLLAWLRSHMPGRRFT